MRDILFRAKRLDNGEWVEGSLLQLDFEKQHVFIIPRHETASSLSITQIIAMTMKRVDIKTVCQDTGLTDRNGKKIWENDIVKASYLCGIKQKDEIGTVEWLNGAFCFKHNDEEYGRHFLGYVNDAEVIGNIFDDSDLLTAHEDEQTRIISMNNTINAQEVELRLCRTEIGKLQRKVIDLEEENLRLEMALKG